jgi:hypothetical protein
MKEMKASQIIDSLGMHDAAVKRAFSQSYSWNGGEWVLDNPKPNVEPAALQSLARLGAALGAAQVSLAQVSESSTQEDANLQLARSLSGLCSLIGNVSAQFNLNFIQGLVCTLESESAAASVERDEGPARSKPSILEAGPWKAGISSPESNHVRAFIDSGDFEGRGQALEYADEVAKRLNMSRATPNKSTT